MRKLAIAVVVAIVVLVVGDRVGDAVAERAVADTLQSSQHLASRPDVDISGFPFLTQLISRDFDQITVVARNVPLTDRAGALRVSTVTAVMRDVKVDYSLGRATIGHATATALISYADLSSAFGVDVSYADGGNVKVSKTVSIAGQSFTPGVTVSPQLVGGALMIFGTSIPLDRIPFELSVQSLSAGPLGIVVILSGRNITLHEQ